MRSTLGSFRQLFYNVSKHSIIQARIEMLGFAASSIQYPQFGWRRPRFITFWIGP
jgi:hypothetical protein